jgi:hypothetical protein
VKKIAAGYDVIDISGEEGDYSFYESCPKLIHAGLSENIIYIVN